MDPPIVHRDVKPANVFLTHQVGLQDFVKVLDFGIAKLAGEESLTRSAERPGTPRYMSPEQCLGQPLDGRSDLYSLGVMMYEMACGSPPFQSDTPLRLLMMHVQDEPEPLRDRAPHVSPAFHGLVMSLLRKNPDDRPGSAEDLMARIAAIRRLGTHLPAVLEEEVPTAPLGDRPVTRGAPPASPPPASIPRRAGGTLRDVASPSPPVQVPSGGRPTRGKTLRDAREEPEVQPPSASVSFDGPVVPSEDLVPTTPLPGMGAPSRPPTAEARAATDLPRAREVAGEPQEPSPPASDGGALAPTRYWEPPEPEAERPAAEEVWSAVPRARPRRKQTWVYVALAAPVLAVTLALYLGLRPSQSPKEAASHDSARGNVESQAADIRDDQTSRADAARPAEALRLPAGLPAELFAVVPAGRYVIGCKAGAPLCADDASPPRTVDLPAFAIMKFEVSGKEYLSCVQRGICPRPREDQNCKPPDDPDLPMTCVDWYSAFVYCRAIGGRLPAEAEWEVAARGTDGRDFPWGSDPPSCDRTVLAGCGSGPGKPGATQSDRSPFGVFDMGGNVREWVEDEYRPYPGGRTYSELSGRVNRGGSFAQAAEEFAASHNRDADEPTARYRDLGFRCAVSW